jgi:hypothetical protein
MMVVHKSQTPAALLPFAASFDLPLFVDFADVICSKPASLFST